MPLTPIQVVCSALFLIACGVALYALIGYPLLLGWIARRTHNPVQKDDELRKVSVVIAVYNGEKFLERKLNSLFAQNYPRELMEVLVVSDGSTDRTDEIAKSFADRGVRFLRVPRGGKAAALNAGVPLVAGEILVLNDVRQTLDANCMRNVIACFGDPKVGAVSPQTIIVQGETLEESTTSLYWRYEHRIRLSLTRIDSTFGYSGAFAAIRRELWVPLPPGTLLDDVYEPLVAFFKGYRILMEPTATMYDFPTALHSEFRRKVRLQAGLYQMLKMMPELLSSRNRMRLHFLSAKYGRIVIPYCMILAAVATNGLPPHFRVPAALAQVLFYGLALLDTVVPEGVTLKKVTAPIRTFVVLMAASLAAVRVYFVPPTSLWKDVTYRPSIAERPQSAEPKEPTRV